VKPGPKSAYSPNVYSPYHRKTEVPGFTCRVAIHEPSTLQRRVGQFAGRLASRFYGMYEAMKCPKCGSCRIRRSTRRGIGEGLFLRMILRAPFRCLDCGARFIASSTDPSFRKQWRHSTLASYLGIRTEDQSFLDRILAIVALGLLILLAVSFVRLYISKQEAAKKTPKLQSTILGPNTAGS
jgi:hypothetical protein